MEELLAALQDALGIPEIEVVSIKVEGDTVQVRAKVVMRKSRCTVCGRVSDRICQYLGREVRHIPIWNRKTILEFDEYQYVCDTCGNKWLGPLGFLSDKYMTHTKQYEKYLFERVRGDTSKRLAELEGLPPRTVQHIVDRYGRSTYPQKRELPSVRSLGFDEVSTRKGHRHFRAVLYDLDRGTVLEVLEDRLKATVVAFLKRQPEAWLRAIKVVAMDMWEGYYQAAKEVLSWAKIVADKFHVIKKLGEEISNARREIQRNLPEEKRKEMKGIRWALIKNPKNLKEKEKANLERALREVPELRQMHVLLNEFREILTGKARKVRRTLRDWVKRVRQTGLAALEKFTRTLEDWWEEVVNAVELDESNGPAEGLNNALKALTRRVFGFRNFQNLRWRILHELGA